MDGIEQGAGPSVLPLPNPSRLAEVKSEDVLRWTQGRALVATWYTVGDDHCIAQLYSDAHTRRAPRTMQR